MRYIRVVMLLIFHAVKKCARSFSDLTHFFMLIHGSHCTARAENHEPAISLSFSASSLK